MLISWDCCLPSLSLYVRMYSQFNLKGCWYWLIFIQTFFCSSLNFSSTCSSPQFMQFVVVFRIHIHIVYTFQPIWSFQWGLSMKVLICCRIECVCNLGRNLCSSAKWASWDTDMKKEFFLDLLNLLECYLAATLFTRLSWPLTLYFIYSLSPLV